MLRLDDFTANVAKSGLVSPEVVAFVQSQLDPLPADDAAVAAGATTDRRGLAHRLSGPQAPRREPPGGSFWGAIDCSASWAKGAWARSTWPSATIAKTSRSRSFRRARPSRKKTLCKRFRREMDLSQRCSHPNLARTISVGNDGDVHFMVMEYIPGKSLYQLVKSERDGPLRVPDAARLFLKLVDGLEAAHKTGLVHRDIKPSNIMITPDGDVKLLDMGLARALDDETGLTRVNTVLGTLDYASPEQLRDAAKADMRSDLYSVGCTLYFALAGQAPFEGGDMINKIYRQRLEDPEPLENLARGVPAAFAAVVRKLMSKEPAERHQNCAELRSDLMRWTDPARVRAILGTEAEAARSFRPPPRSSSRTTSGCSIATIRRQPRRLLAPRPGRRRAVHRPPPPGPHAPAARHRSLRRPTRSHHADCPRQGSPTTRAGSSSSPSSPPSRASSPSSSSPSFSTSDGLGSLFATDRSFVG